MRLFLYEPEHYYHHNHNSLKWYSKDEQEYAIKNLMKYLVI